MKQEIAKRAPGTPSAYRKDAFLFDVLDEVKKRADVFIQSGLVPKQWVEERGKPIPAEKAVARLAIAFQAGQEAGFRSYQECLNYMYVVNNLPTVYGSGNNILIQRNPNFRGVVRNEWDDKYKRWTLTVKVNSHGEINEVTTTFSEADAKNSGLTERNQNYKKYMKQMCERKCWARMYQIHFPGGIESYDYMDHTEVVQQEWQDMSGEFDPQVLEGKSKEDLIEMSISNPDLAPEINEKLAQLDDIAEDVEVEEVDPVFDTLEKFVKAGRAGKIKRKNVGFAYITADEEAHAAGLTSPDAAQDMIDHLSKRLANIKQYEDLLPQLIGPDGDGFKITDYATGEEVSLKAKA